MQPCGHEPQQYPVFCSEQRRSSSHRRQRCRQSSAAAWSHPGGALRAAVAALWHWFAATQIVWGLLGCMPCQSPFCMNMRGYACARSVHAQTLIHARAQTNTEQTPALEGNTDNTQLLSYGGPHTPSCTRTLTLLLLHSFLEYPPGEGQGHPQVCG